MMIRQATAPKVNLGASKFCDAIAVDMQRWFEFNFWIAEELLDLVAEHELNERRQKAKPRSQFFDSDLRKQKK